MGWAQKDIAGKSGMSAGRVSQLLELNTLPVSIQQLIVEGKISSAFALNVWKKHNQNLEAAFTELTAAIEAANAEGRTRAMPKDTVNGEGSEGGSKGKSGGTKSNLKSFIKKLVEQAYADERIDDTESMVTMTLSEADWAELMEKIDY